jgi:hypothetical protein
MAEARQEIRQFSAAWRSFKAGATQPNFASAMIMLTVMVLCFAILTWLASARLLAGDGHRLLMDGPLDTQTHATHQLLAASPAEEPSILVFGSSVMVRCVKGAPTLEQLIAEQANVDAKVYNLSTDAQTTWEIEAMIDQFPAGGHGVVVFGTSYGVWMNSVSDLEKLIREPKLGFPTPTIDAAARAEGISVPFRTGVFGLDASKYFLAHRKAVAKNLIYGGLEYGDPLDAYWMQIVNNQSFWDKEIAQLPDLVAQVETNLDANIETVRRTIRSIKQKGDYSIVLYEAPIHPGWFEVDGGDAFFSKIRRALQNLADDEGVVFAAARDRVPFEAKDFVDFEGHLGNDEIRMACTRDVAETIAEELVL